MRRSAPATFIAPMKALGTTEVPTGHWHCEIKFDGYRALAVLNEHKVELWSRNHRPLGADYPAAAAALAGLKCRSAVLDGEIVALDATGRSRFQLLQRCDVSERPHIVLFVFDLLHLDGRDLTGRPIEDRRQILTTLLGKSKGPLQLSK